MRDTFILYTSYAEQISLLDMEQRGLLLTAILAHENEQMLPELDPITAMAWAFIKDDLDRNYAKYEEISEKRRAAGRASGRSRRASAEQRTSVQSVEQNEHCECEYDCECECVCECESNRPTLAQVTEYSQSRGSKSDPEAFFAYYDSQGWITARGNPVTNWKSLYVNWEKRERPKNKSKPNTWNLELQRKDEMTTDFERAIHGSNKQSTAGA